MVHYLGQIGVLLGLLALPPIVVGVITGAWAAVGVQAGVATLFAGGGHLVSRRHDPDRLQENEALVIVAGAFVLAAGGAAAVFLAHGLSGVDAVFEAISGVTTTGLSVVSNVSETSLSFRFDRAWAQWYGGLGFVTLASAMLGRGHLVNRIAGMEEDAADPLGGMRAHAQRVLVIYVTLTLAGAVVILLLGAAPFEAVIHALAAVSTGGFSTTTDSLAGMGVPVRIAVLVLCILGSISFVTIHRTVRDSWRAAIDDVQLRMLLAMAVLGAGAIYLFEWSAGAGGGTATAGHALATAVSAQTTAGFSTLSLAELSPASRIVLLGAMFVGGCVGSSAGGLKQARFLMVLGSLRRRIARTAMPRDAVYVPRLAGRKIEPSEARRILELAFGWVLLIGLVWLALAAYGYDPLNALFDVVSATGTVGLSTGVVSAELEPSLKGLLSLAMLVGRLELVAMLVLLAPGTWIGRRKGGA